MKLIPWRERSLRVERSGCDVICLATRARGGLAAAILGFVAREVLARAARPVLVLGPLAARADRGARGGPPGLEVQAPPPEAT